MNKTTAADRKGAGVQKKSYDNLEDMLLSEPKLLFLKQKRIRQLQKKML